MPASKSKSLSRERLYKMVIAAMLAALTAVITFTPIGLIPLPPPLPNATTVHIPVIIAALCEGWGVGLFVGLVFGTCSLINAWGTGKVGLTLFFRNPLVSVLPRLMVPCVAILLFTLWKKFFPEGKVKDKIGAAITAVLASLTNTVCCLGMIALIYGGELTELVNNAIQAGSTEAAYLDNAGAWLVAAVGVPNGIAESLLAALIVPTAKLAIDAVKHRRGGKKSLPKEANP